MQKEWSKEKFKLIKHKQGSMVEELKRTEESWWDLRRYDEAAYFWQLRISVSSVANDGGRAVDQTRAIEENEKWVVRVNLEK